MRASRLAAAACGLLLAAVTWLAPAFAHHGWSEYDRDKPLALSGTVTEVSYANPHATLRLDAGGKSWLVVLAPPSRMSSRGIASGDIKPGTAVGVEGYPSRNEPGEMRAERITLGGKVYELR
ncbi:MAG TPA: DUF6152 family protein [Burkholderiales bacterium]|nr:DUF6152 family protein [Burkholderiales bacterium]